MKPTAYLRQVTPLLASKVENRVDAWENLVTGLGNALRDKRKGQKFVRSLVLSEQLLDAMYSDDDLVATIVDAFPDQALRKGFHINIAPDDDKNRDSVQAAQGVGDEMMARLEDEFGTTEKANEAWRWGRLFGGGIMYVVADDGADENEELREDRIKTIISLEGLDRSELTPRTFYSDPDHPKFGQTETYLITASSANAQQGAQFLGATVHETRLIIFPGARTTRRRRAEQNGWDSSIIQRMQETLEDFNSSFSSVAHLMTDANQAVFKIKGLVEMISGGLKDELTARMQLVDVCRSVVRAVLLDADSESFERNSPSFAGIPDVLDREMMRLSAASHIPVTLLMGKSPDGENATGESDFRAFYGEVEAMQTHILKPRLKRWVKLNFLAKDGPTKGQEPDKWSITFPELWQLTPSEWAGVRKDQSETDENYILQGVLQPEEIRGSRFGPRGFSPETMIDPDLDLAEDELEPDTGEPDEPVVDEPQDEPADEPVEPAKAALTGVQSVFLITVAEQVQTGVITKESGVASLLAANPTMTNEEASTIAGEPSDDQPTPKPPPNGPPPPPPPSPGGGSGHEDEDEDED